MEAVCYSLGVARSNVHARYSRPASWVDRRSGRSPSDDEELAEALGAEVFSLPSYGYRRAQALVNRQRKAAGEARVNHKRVCRVMNSAGLLRPKAPRRPESARQHGRTVAMTNSDAPWCSDGSEMECDRGGRPQVFGGPSVQLGRPRSLDLLLLVGALLSKASVVDALAEPMPLYHPVAELRPTQPGTRTTPATTRRLACPRQSADRQQQDRCVWRWEIHGPWRSL